MLLLFLLFNQAVLGTEYSVSRAAHGKQISHSYIESRGDAIASIIFAVVMQVLDTTLNT